MRTNVAVYGTLKHKQDKGYMMGRAQYLGRSSVPGFDMYSLGAYPAIVEGEGTIEVEVYSVDESTLRNLDMYEGVGFGLYKRQEVKTDHGPAQIYVWGGLHDLDEHSKIKSGVWE